jgi:RNA polymerase sigma factor (sigma-70 family)
MNSNERPFEHEDKQAEDGETDEQAFAKLHARVTRRVDWYIRRWGVTRPQDVDDVSQEVYVTLWRYRKNAKELEAFVKHVAGWKAAEHLRWRCAHPECELDEQTLESLVTPDPVQAFEQQQLLDSMLRKVRGKPGKVLRLVRVEGYSHKEAAAATNLSLNAVDKYVRDGMAELKRLIELESTHKGASK